MKRRFFLKALSLAAAFPWGILKRIRPEPDITPKRIYRMNPEWINARYEVAFIGRDMNVHSHYPIPARWNRWGKDGEPIFIDPWIEA
jgi:hypothetical protein